MPRNYWTHAVPSTPSKPAFDATHYLHDPLQRPQPKKKMSWLDLATKLFKENGEVVPQVFKLLECAKINGLEPSTIKATKAISKLCKRIKEGYFDTPRASAKTGKNAK